MAKPPFPILYEDNHLLVVNKPAMLPTMGAPAGVPTVLNEAKDYIKRKYDKPGEVYLGTVSRLDAPVTGVMIFARTSKAAARLTDQFKKRKVDKVYWALVEGQIAPPEGRLENWLRKDERHRRVHIARGEHADSQRAVLTYETLRKCVFGAHLEVRLETGRKHQIRVQLAHAECPILGDRKYNARRSFPTGIALHSRRLTFEHPVRREPIDLIAPTPDYWTPFLSEDAQR